MQNISSSELALNPPSTLDVISCSYNVTLSMILEKHAPTISHHFNLTLAIMYRTSVRYWK